MKNLVYLSGPISGLTLQEATEWREDATDYLEDYGITCYSPLRGKGYLRDGAIPTFVQHGAVLSTPQSITKRDKHDVRRCDAMLLNLLGSKDVSKGSMIEVGWADAWDKLMVVVMEPHNIHRHPILETAAICVSDLQLGMDMLINFLYDGDITFESIKNSIITAGIATVKREIVNG